ncbi:MAG: non-ribosomal peptide synthase/polyketide synthase [Pseudomonadota bacterium]
MKNPPAAPPLTLVEVLRRRALHEGDAAAFTFLEHGERVGARLSFAQLDRRARGIAAHLQRSCAPGDRVLLAYPPGLDYIAAFFGCLYAGLIAVPALPPANAKTLPRLLGMVEDARPRLALSSADTVQRMRDLSGAQDSRWPKDLRWFDLDSAEDLSDAWVPPPVAAGDIAFLQYTSGSTGAPKGVMVTHANLLANAQAIGQTYGVGAGDVFLSWLPPHHDFGLIGSIATPVVLGGHCVQFAPAAFLMRPHRWLKAISDWRAKITGGPNFAYALCVEKVTEAQKQGLDLSCLQVAVNGAERVRSATLREFADAFAGCGLKPNVVTPSYGLAESTLLVSASRQQADAIAFTRMVERDGLAAIELVGAGEAAAGSEVVIVDAQAGTAQPVGAVGEIWVRGPSVAAGYWGREEETEQVFGARLAGSGHRYLRTGDLGFLDEAGHLYVTGRLKEMMIFNGENVYPQDIEATVEAQDAAFRANGCAAFSVEEDSGKARLVLVQELETRGKPDTESLIGKLRLALYEQHGVTDLAAVLLVKAGQLPRTSSGKIQRVQCGRMFREGAFEPVWEWREGGEAQAAEAASSYVAPATATEAALAWIWQELLGVPSVSVEAEFFALGGHSLLAGQVAAQVRDSFGVELTLQALFEAPTVRALAAKIDELVRDGAAQPSPQPSPSGRGGREGGEEEDAPLSFAQQRLWFLDQYEPGDAAYNIPIAVRLRGRLDRDALRDALNGVVARHDALRTRFGKDDGGEPRQIVDARLHLDLPLQDIGQADAADAMQAEARAPFDLGRGPLIRALLLRRSADEHVLLLTLHHIVSDGWSMGVLVRELGALYAARVQGRDAALPPLPIQYADHARWQRERLQGEELQKHVSYWTRQLAGAPSVLTLPTNHPRPAVQRHHGARHDFVIGADLTRRLKACAQSRQATLFMGLSVVFAALLARYAGQQEVNLGTAVANRGRSQTEGLIGFFVNTLVLRIGVDAGDSFETLLGRVKHTALEAFAHQELPFEKLVEVLNPQRHGGHAPLVQALLVLQNAPLGKAQLPGLTLEELPIHNGTSKFDLVLTVTEEQGALSGKLEYDSDLFEAGSIAQLVRHFVRLLEQAVVQPEARVMRLPLLDAEEQQRVLVDWNAPRASYPRDATIAQLFERRVREGVDAVAVSFEGEHLSYAELNARANRLAHCLRAQGVGPDVLVGVRMERGLELIVALLAILKAGGAYLPIDPSYPEERVAGMLADAKPRLVLTEAWLPQLQAQPETNPAPLGTASNLAYVIYTSGSTGVPKGAQLTHANVTRLLASTQDLFRFDSSDVWTLFHSYAFDFSVWEIWGALLHGGRLVVVPHLVTRSPEQFLELLAQEKVTVLNQTPSAFQQLIQADQSANVQFALKHVIFGGEALNRAALAPWFARHGYDKPRLVNMYGITETTVHVTWHVLARDNDGAPGAIGRPLADLACYVLDGFLNPVPVGVAGELYVTGAGVARGYLNRAALTAERFVPDPFATEPGVRMYRSGDLARYLPEGTLDYLGRADHQVKIRGFRIELGEIEAALMAQPGVREALVLAREDAPGDKRLVAYIVADNTSLDAASLRKPLLARLPDYMVPAHYVLLDAFPLTSNGKIDRKALPLPAGGASTGTAYEAPVGDIEEKIAAAWSQLLSVERVGRHDNFFALGGHSLLAVNLIEQLRRQGVAADVRSVFASATLAELAASVGAPDAADVPPNRIRPGSKTLTPDMLPLVQLTPAEIRTVVAAVPGGAANIQDIYPLAPLQEGLLFLHRMQQQGDAYLQRAMLAFDTREALDRFTAALQQAIDREDILRTAFLWEGLRQPVQVVWRQARMQVDVLALSPAQGDVLSQLRARHDPRRDRLDLGQAPLLRCTAAQDAPNGRWLLQLLFHHLIHDAASMRLLVSQVQAILAGQGGRLAAPVPFRNYVASARRMPQAGHEAFFRAQLGDLEEPTAPFGLAATRDEGMDIVQARTMLDADLARRLRAQARLAGVSAASLMHLAWAQVLARGCGRTADVVFGTVLFGRMQGGAGAAQALGPFINTLPIRIRLGRLGVRDSLLRAHQALSELLVHEHAPLALAQRCSALPAQVPLFTALLNYRHDLPQDGVAAAENGLQARVLETEERTNYPLAMMVDDLGEGFGLVAQVAAGTVAPERICGYMLAALRGIVDLLEAQPDAPVGRVDVLPSSEHEQLIVEWNATRMPYARDVSMVRLVEQQVERTPDAVAVACEDVSLSYAQLNARANRLAHWLCAQGVGPEVLVGVRMERGLDVVVTLLGILKAGGAYLPLDPNYPAERIQVIVDEAKPRLVITELGAELASRPVHNPESRVLPGNLAYVIYTSGSTGRPKGVGIRHGAVSAFLAWVHDVFDAASLRHVLAGTSLNFDLSVFELFAPLTCGGTVWMVPNVLALMQGSKAASAPLTLINTVPSAAGQLERSGAIPASVKVLNVAGEALPAQLVRQVYATTQVERMYNLYGPSEDTTYSTWALMPRDIEGAVPIGRPIANSQTYLLDEALNPVPAGVPGELYMAGDGLARGYLHRPDLTAERFLPDPFGPLGSRMYRTGDLARHLADGSIEYLGRVDHQVKIRGFRIELGEIEAAMTAQAGVRDALVLAREDSPGDKRLAAYLVAKPGHTLSVTELRAAIAKRLPDYMVPAHFVVLDAFPMSPNGKIDRKALPAPEGGTDAAAYIAPRTPTEHLLAAIWSQALNVARVGAQDRFFELGGHSLIATQLVSQVRERMGIELPLRTVFEAPVLADLAARIDDLKAEQAHAAALPLARIPRGGPLKLSFAQHRLWFLDQFEPGSALYNIPVVLRVAGMLDAGALERALNQVVRRHEVLRTAFAARQGEPEQVVADAVEIRIALEDLGALPDDAREREAQAKASAEAAATFDLARGPLLRARLLKLSADDHLLVLTLHHIVADGWSLGVLLREMSQLYAAQLEDRPATLPELPIQYADYAHWQRQWLQAGEQARQVAYWKDTLQGLPARLELPTDRPRPAVQSHRGATLTTRLPASTTSALHKLAQRTNTTLFMALAAALDVLLWRYSGQDDFAIGTPIANRTRGETEGLIGFFVNTLVLRSRIDARASFADLLAQVRQTTLAAYAHQDIPFEQLVDELKPERHTSHSPLFQVMLALQNAPLGALKLPGLELRPLPNDGASAKFDLLVNAVEQGDTLELGFEYALDLFDAETIARMAAHYALLLEAACTDENALIGVLPMLSREESRRIVVDWNEPHVGYPQSATIAQLFEQQVQERGDAIAVSCEGKHLSYAELNAQANRLAHALRAQGVGPDVLVGVRMERGLELIVALLAVLKSGGAYLPIDPSYPEERVAAMLADAQPLLVLTEALLPDLQSQPDTDLAPLGAADNLAYVIYTSGSTGVPKGAQLTHANVTRLLASTQDLFRFDSSDVWTLFHSYAFDFSVWEIWGALLHGGRLVVVPHLVTRSPEQFLELLEREQVTVLNQTPSAFQQLIQTDQNANAQLALKHVIFGGEALNRAALAPWFAKHGYAQPRLVNMYGITETTVHVTWHVLERDNDGAPGAIGRPLADLACYVLDDFLNPVPVGVAGELYVTGAGVARGYLNRAALTAERFLPDPFATEPGARMYRSGDLARYLPDGTLDYLGRADHQVKIRGFRIELGEIEAALTAQPGVREALVLAREDALGDKRLVAYIVADDAALDATTLRKPLLARLPDYMVPAHYVLLDAFPLTSNGKIDRKALPSPEMGSQAAAAYVAPGTPTEELLASIWSHTLHVERVGAQDDFFALGGHSLLATQVVSQIRDRAGVELPLRVLFEAPVLSELAARIDAQKAEEVGTPAMPLVRIDRNGPLQLSFAQHRLWFLDQYEPGSPLYNIPIVLRLAGRLDAGAMQRALGDIVRRHETLRTTFTMHEGEPRQVIAEAQPVALPLDDLAALPAAEREVQAQARARDEALVAFDLARGPLLRARLLKLSDDDHLLVLTLHHIVADGWSLGVLLREMSELYAAQLENRPAALPELPIQYADYAHWQRQWLQGDEHARQVAYWKDALQGLPARLELPTDRPRPAVQSHRGAVMAMQLPASTTAALHKLAQRSGATLFMALAAALDVLLWRYSGQDDFAIGTPIANRTRGETEGLIGFFVNTLVLRSRIDARASFADLLAQVRQTTLAAYAHQDIPFEQLVDELKPERHTSHSPLFQVMLALQNAPLGALKLPGLELRPLPNDGASAKFDLLVNAVEQGDTLELGFEYALDLFDAETIARMAAHYARLLEAACADETATIGTLPMLSPPERQRIVSEWNNTAVAFPQDAALLRLFERNAETLGDATALIFEDQHLGYAELNTLANRLAHHLRAQGVCPDAIVAICAERSVEMVVMVLAVLKAGAAYMPLDPALPVQRLGMMLADAKPALVLALGATQARAGEALAQAGGLQLPVFPVDLRGEELGKLPSANPSVRTQPTNLAYVLYTSGSTGTPKGVAMTAGALRNLITWQLADQPNLGAAQRKVLQFASLNFDVSSQELLSTLCAGDTLLLVDAQRRQDMTALRAFISDAGIDRMFVPNAVLQQLSALPAPAGASPGRACEIVTAGEQLVMSDALVAYVRELGNAGIANQYGPTETHVVTQQLLRGDPAAWPAMPPIGRPIANARIHVLDAQLEPAPVGVTGELYIAGAALARGYLNRPALTAERFIPDPFSTQPGARMYRSGDLARYLPDGSIQYAGRADDQVKLRGFRIELGEIEAAFAAMPEVADVAVRLREDRPGDKRLVAYLAPQGGMQLPEATALRERLSATLPEYMVPSAIVAMQALPLNASGKIDRRALPAPELPSAGTEYIAPRNAMEQELAAIWREVLGVPKVGIHDSFFELGGHSFLATRLVAKVHQRLQAALPLAQLFTRPTIAGIAGWLQGAGTSTFQSVPLLPDAPSYALSHAQLRLWLIQQLRPDSTAYHQPAEIVLPACATVPQVQDALNALAARHPSLRTVFAPGGEAPAQVILPSLEFPLEVAEAGSREELDHLAAAHAARPFDLEHGPLCRGIFVTLWNGGAMLLWNMHHVIADGWSIGILQREATALLEGHALPPAPQLRYVDFAAWQNNLLQGDADGSRAFWHAELAGELPQLDLPYDTPLSAHTHDAGAAYRFTVSANVMQPLQQFVRTEQATLFNLLLAAMLVWLHRATGQGDLIVGAPVSGRPHADLEPVVGNFSNAVMLRNGIDAREPFAALLRRVRDRTLEALRHQAYPLELLLNELGVAADGSRFPVSPVFLNLLNFSDVAQAAPAGVPLHRALAQEVKFDLNFYIAEQAGGLEIDCHYRTACFTADTVQYLCGEFARVLAEVAVDAHQPVGGIALFALDERHVQPLAIADGRVFEAFRAEDIEQTIAAHFEVQAARFGDRVAVSDAMRALSYAELNAAANAVAQELGDAAEASSRIALLFQHDTNMVVGMLGALKSGCAYVPLDPSYPTARLRFMLEDAQVGCLVADGRTLALARELAAGLPARDGQPLRIVDIDGLAPRADHPTRAQVQPTDPAYILYTSGSTGQPKGVMQSHRNALHFCRQYTKNLRIDADDRLCLLASYGFDAAVMDILGALLNGARLVIADPRGGAPHELVERILAERISIYHSTPTLYRHLFGAAPQLQASPLRLVVLGGEPVAATDLALFDSVFPADCVLVNGYGPTESTLALQQFIRHGETSLQPPAAGLPIEGTAIALGEPDAKPHAYQSGEIIIRSEHVALGYWNAPELTTAAFGTDAQGQRFYRTGDVGRRGRDGRITVQGRIDQQVKVRGYRIELGEIETALKAAPGVREAVVSARQDGAGDARLVAYVVPQDGAVQGVDAKTGFSLFYFGADKAEQDSDYDFYLNSAKFADSHGFEAIWTPERHFDAVGSLYPNPSVLNAALATATTNVKLRAGSVVLPLHHPLRVAEEWAVVDRISKGRVGMAIASGWHARDFVLAPERFEPRRQVVQQGIETLKALWRGESVSLPDGAGGISEVRTFPRPVQAELPLWVTAAGNPETFKHAGRIGANLLTHLLGQTVERLTENIALYRAALVEHGHDPATRRVSLMVHTFVGDDYAATIERARPAFVRYLRAHVELWRPLMKNVQDADRQPTEQEIADVLDYAFQRYSRTAALIGTPQSCLPIVRALQNAGVHEFACLIDWMDASDAFGALDSLAALRELALASSPPTPRSLAEHCRARLPDYMVPAQFMLLDVLPLTPTGKVDRRALPAPEDDGYGRAAYVAPRNATEQALAEIWSETLRVDAVGIEDNFFALGGHSLLALKLIQRIEKRFGVRIALTVLVQNAVLRELAAALDQLTGAADAGEASFVFPAIASDTASQHQPFPLNHVQQAYWIGRSSAMALGGVGAHNYMEIRIRGLDLGRFSRALNRLVARHAMLRAVFSDEGTQRILAEVPGYVVPVLDLRGKDAAMVAAGLGEVREALSHQLFDAAVWPLFEFRVTLLDGGTSMLHVSTDALVRDTTSNQIIGYELERLYTEPDAPLPELALTFRDYVLAERALESSSWYQRALAYWRGRLDDFAPAPELPLARRPDSIARPKFTRRRGGLDAAAWSRMKARAQRAAVTPSALLMAVFSEVLAAWCKRPRFTINLTLFNRLPLHPQVNDIVGDFTSLILLEANPDAGKPFVANAQAVQAQLWRDIDHAAVSGIQVLRELSQKTGAQQAGMPIVFTSTLTNQNEHHAPEPGAGNAGVFGEIVYQISQTPQVWLDHQVGETAGALFFNWDAIDEIFPDGMLDEMFASYCARLEALAGEDAQWEQPAPALLGEASLRVQAEANAGDGFVPEDARLEALFERQALLEPGRIAVVAGARELTYGDLRTRSRDIAAQLQSRGAGANQLVAVVMERGWEQAVATLAILYAGAAYLPLDPALPAERLHHIMARAGVKLALTQRHLAQAVEWPQGVEHIAVPAAAPSVPQEPAPVRGPTTDLAYVIYTSGSTGEPKGVMIDHRGAVNTVLDINRRFGVGAEDRVLAISSLSFDLSVYDLFGIFAAGGAVVVLAPDAARDPQAWAETLAAHRVTVWNSVPALLDMLLEYADGRDGVVPHTLRLAMLSGDWIPLGLPRRWHALRPDARIVSLGGATEASIWSIFHGIDEVRPDWRSIPYGKPLARQSFHVLDAALHPRPVWVPGELYIGGIGVAQGYWGDERRTAASFIRHPRSGERLYRTGDFGRYLPDGSIEFLGREDTQVKVQGYRIELGEIESALARHPEVQAAVVHAVGDPRGEKRLAAYVVPKEGADPQPDVLRGYLAAKLPPYMVPAMWMLLDALPLSSNGKVDKSRLPAIGVAAAQAGDETPFALAGDAELRIAAIVSGILAQQEVAPAENLLSLGATSIDIVRIGNALSTELGFRPPLARVLATPTLRELVGMYREHREQNAIVQAAQRVGQVQPAAASGTFASIDDPEARQAFKDNQPGLRRFDDSSTPVALPAPVDPERAQLLQAMRSVRQFLPEPVGTQAFAELLACLGEGTLDGKPKYLYPSAGGLYPVQTYVWVKPERVQGVAGGAYYYDPKRHGLVRTSDAGVLTQEAYGAFVGGPLFQQSAFAVFFVAELAAIGPLYGDKSLEFCHIEAGAMAQLMTACAAPLALGLCGIGMVDVERIAPLFRLQSSHRLVYSMVGGARAGDEAHHNAPGELNSLVAPAHEEIEI